MSDPEDDSVKQVEFDPIAYAAECEACDKPWWDKWEDLFEKLASMSEFDSKKSSKGKCGDTNRYSEVILNLGPPISITIMPGAIIVRTEVKIKPYDAGSFRDAAEFFTPIAHELEKNGYENDKEETYIDGDIFVIEMCKYYKIKKDGSIVMVLTDIEKIKALCALL